jgi:hypothetical protein
MKLPNLENAVIDDWIIRENENYPRFGSCYIKRSIEAMT